MSTPPPALPPTPPPKKPTPPNFGMGRVIVWITVAGIGLYLLVTGIVGIVAKG